MSKFRILLGVLLLCTLTFRLGLQAKEISSGSVEGQPEALLDIPANVVNNCPRILGTNISILPEFLRGLVCSSLGEYRIYSNLPLETNKFKVILKSYNGSLYSIKSTIKPTSVTSEVLEETVDRKDDDFRPVQYFRSPTPVQGVRLIDSACESVADKEAWMKIRKVLLQVEKLKVGDLQRLFGIKESGDVLVFRVRKPKFNLLSADDVRMENVMIMRRSSDKIISLELAVLQTLHAFGSGDASLPPD